jgi:hypothetical protein
MTSRPARVFIAVLAAWFLAGSAVAYAHLSPFETKVEAALRDCSSNDPLKGHYSLKVLQTALKDVKAEALQYTGCADVLIAAIHKQSLGTVTKTTRPVIVKQGQKAIRRRVDRLQSEGGAPLTLPSGQTVTPGTVVTHSASFLSTLPTSLAIVLAALLAAVLAVSGRALHNVVRARRSR